MSQTERPELDAEGAYRIYYVSIPAKAEHLRKDIFRAWSNPKLRFPLNRVVLTNNQLAEWLQPRRAC